MPADLNRAGYVRQLGSSSIDRGTLPRALLPLAATDRAVQLSSLRDATRPAERIPTPAGQTIDLWIDLTIPARTAPGDYDGAIELLGANDAVVASLPLKLTVYNFVIGEDRDLQLVGELPWDQLTQLFPESFEAVTPRLISRGDPRYAKSITTVDTLIGLAQKHRVSVYIDRLQPTVKWPPGGAPDVSWGDFDGLVGPWLDGSAFPDNQPIGAWPLPAVDYLENYPIASRKQYINIAAAHFDSRDWLTRAPVWIGDRSPKSGPEKRELLRRAADVLNSHPRVRVALPIEADDLEFANDTSTQDLPNRGTMDRIVTSAPGLVSNTPSRAAVAGNQRGIRFLRTDNAGLVPYVGAGGDERDVRVWAFLAYVRNASIVRFGSALPRATRAQERANPNELVWFYPGRWFGVDGVIPTLQLKWLRRAQQDFQYLRLADQRGQRINAQLMARLLTKPVEITPTQPADAIYSLMAGTIDPKAWDDGMTLLAKTILLREPGQQPDADLQNKLNLETLQWLRPQEKPLLIGRTALFAPVKDRQTLDVRLGIDIYNASDATEYENLLGYDRVPSGWTVEPNPIPVRQLTTYGVQPLAMQASVDVSQFDAARQSLIELGFTQGFTRDHTTLPIVVPVAPCRHREGNLMLDGSLGDWTDDDAIRLGPLVKMIDRAVIQGHSFELASTPTSLYTCWGEQSVYFAFRVQGLNTQNLAQAQNFVRYQFGRAWGEDVVQLLVQPVYEDGSAGPVLHVACKPNGGQWSERKTDARAGPNDENAWEAVESGVRYASTLEGDIWRGEVSIPWRAIHPAGFAPGPGKRVALLRFNFAQHQHKFATSATWAGPVDLGRDDGLMGALVIKD
ncbi:MAG: hypothetical protein QM770_17695 [Tepidisphaeraceae bacterium]